MTYRSETPPLNIDPDLADYLNREHQRIENAISSLLDGEQESQNKDPGGNEPLLRYSDGTYDFGDGAGLYLRIGTQWYKLEMKAVAGIHPSIGAIEFVGHIPTIS